MVGRKPVRPAARKRRVKKTGIGKNALVFAGMLIFALLGYAAGYFMDTGKPLQSTYARGDNNHQELLTLVKNLKMKIKNGDDLLTRIESLKSQVTDMKEELDKQRLAMKKSSTDVGELTFYHELPRQSVTPVPVSETKVQKRSRKKSEKGLSISGIISRNLNQKQQGKVQTKSSVKYRLQVASFRKATDARKLRKRLLNWGFKTSIRKVNLTGKGLWYRVYTGPYGNRKSVEKANLLVAKKLHRMALVLRVN